MRKIMLLLAILLASCQDKTENGVIIDMHHSPSYCVPFVTIVNKTTIVTNQIVPERFFVDVKISKIDHRRIDVSKDVYYKIGLGDSVYLEKNDIIIIKRGYRK